MCLYPLNGFWTGTYTDNGKKDFIVVDGKTKLLSFTRFQKLYKKAHKYDLRQFHQFDGELYLTDPVAIPCGRCIECRLSYSRDWALRCVLESQDHEFNYFLTLTYDNSYLPANGSLVKKDVQLFIKRLRKYIDSHVGSYNIKYFLCGEYGEHSHRPHYHLLLFNCPLPCLVPLHDNLFVSEPLFKLWPFGSHVIGDVTFESAAYVARYVMKKCNSSSLVFDSSVEPEFVLMSRRPGIGKNYFDSHYDRIYKLDSIYLARYGIPLRFKPPRYFDRLYEKIDSDFLSSVKAERLAFSKSSSRASFLHIGETIDSYDISLVNHHVEYLKTHRLKLLVRTL
ncbi:replication initiator protein [Capybara microvirus Cap3_SP_444]|nr:replication initiator protein [Capybara microvirus Cap3_SP_444]